MKTTSERLIPIIGECTCGEIYLSRGLHAPDCLYHNYLEDLQQQMIEYAEDAITIDRENTANYAEIDWIDIDEGQVDKESIINAPKLKLE